MDKLTIKSTDLEGFTWRIIGAPTYVVEISKVLRTFLCYFKE